MDNTLTIRKTTRDDLAEIDALLRRSYPALLKDHYPPSLMVLAIPLISRANPRLVLSGRYFAVCDSAGAIVGAGGWSNRAPTGYGAASRGTGHIRHVVTDHRRTREGIGRSLMEHILADARVAGVRRMKCLSTRMAVPFYAACGFDPAQPVSVTLAEAIVFPAVLMQRGL